MLLRGRSGHGGNTVFRPVYLASWVSTISAKAGHQDHDSCDMQVGPKHDRTHRCPVASYSAVVFTRARLSAGRLSGSMSSLAEMNGVAIGGHVRP